ncbi:hypothetical protein [Deinococcus fonticola]|uniref:hypothetical protein n=1 Tax=Deinococcus fonticola TaxID=2528713 RepID=UPI001074A590|nr:hypothetical protein [Deinococcus fonticola]
MMASRLTSALISGALIGALNIVFGGLQFGFPNLPLWFYLAQLLLIPAMLFPMRFFPQASMTQNFVQRTALFALGWAVPYAIYKFSGDALSDTFSPLRSLGSYLWWVLILSAMFAVLRAPQKKG